MNPIITEQLNKFKNGDFGGYESFYNETVSTVYTMLHTVVHDSNVATSLVPQVYDKIYQNVTSLEQTNGFYQWAAELANEEALGYLKENGWTEIHNDSVENTYEQAVDGKFYDYAVEDEALTITEDAVLDTSFVTRVQEIVTTLSPMDRVVFQDYYYFGVSVPEIAVKTGCKDSDIRYTLSQTRTAILQTIALAPVDDSENGNYLRPDNIGMPFNSPANDYMYAIDEFNNIGWFASDRYQPDNKVCIYVFVPNSSKEVYNYESTDEQIIINAASLHSIRTTWKDEEKVRTGKQRLAAIMYAKESGEQQKDFTLIIDDSAVYHTLNDFRSAEARKLYQQRIQKQKDYDNLKKNLDDKREQYAQGNSARKKNLTPAILELEKRTEQLLKEMAQLDISVRNEEIKKLKH